MCTSNKSDTHLINLISEALCELRQRGVSMSSVRISSVELIHFAGPGPGVDRYAVLDSQVRCSRLDG